MNEIDYDDEQKVDCLLLSCTQSLTIILPNPCVAEIIPHFEFVEPEKEDVVGHLRWRHTMLDLIDMAGIMEEGDAITASDIKSVAILNAVTDKKGQNFWALPLLKMPETIQVSHVELTPVNEQEGIKHGDVVVYKHKKFVLPDLPAIQQLA